MAEGELMEYVEDNRTVEDIQRLLDKQVDVNYKDYQREGNTALHYCYLYEENNKADEGLKVIQLLLKYGADKAALNSSNETPLQLFLIKLCRLDYFRALLNDDTDIASIVDNDGNTVLHSYPFHREDANRDILENLLKRQSDLNVENKRGETPLMMFVEFRCDIAPIKMLIDAGADVECTDRNGDGVLHHCSHLANYTEVVEFLIKNGADINVKNKVGASPLLYSIKYSSNVDSVKTLLNNGADINVQDNVGSSVLHYFPYCEGSHLTLLKLLVEINCDVNSKNTDGQTPLMVCVSQNDCNIDYVKLLLERGADVHSQDNLGFTVLHKFLENCSDSGLDILILLVKHCRDINIKNSLGNTPLMTYVSEGGTNHDHIKILLDSGADVNTLNHDDEAILHCLARRPDLYDPLVLDVLKLFIQHDANPIVIDGFGRTPLSRFVDTLLLSQAGRITIGDNQPFLPTYIHHQFSQTDKIEIVNVLIKYHILLNDESFFKKHLSIYMLQAKYTSQIKTFTAEVNKMKEYTVKDKLSVYNIFEIKSRIKLGLRFRDINLDSNILNKEFPHYSEFIQMRIELASRWWDILNNIDAICLTSKSGSDDREVELNFHCIRHITNFLSEYDLIKLTCAADLNDYDDKS